MSEITVLSRRGIKWVDGMPVPTLLPAIDPKALMNLNITALATPYKMIINKDTGLPYPEELEYAGLSCAEVGKLRMAQKYSQGDIETQRLMDDRVLGKPKQSMEQVTVNLTMQQFLSRLADREEAIEAEATITVDEQQEPEQWRAPTHRPAPQPETAAERAARYGV